MFSTNPAAVKRRGGVVDADLFSAQQLCQYWTQTHDKLFIPIFEGDGLLSRDPQAFEDFHIQDRVRLV